MPDSPPEDIKKNERFKNIVVFIVSLGCFAGFFSVVVLANIKYGSCCKNFIWSMGALFCYFAAESMIRLSQKENKNKNNENGQNEIKLEKNPITHAVFILCRFVFVIVLIVTLPGTGPCDGQNKEWTLILLIVYASFFVITEALHLIYRALMYCKQ